MTDVIELDKLRVTVNNYYFNVKHEMCAVLVMIKDPKLIDVMGKQFILEVWSRGKQIFERRLHHPPIQCSMSNCSLAEGDYTLMYVAHPSDNDN